MYLFALFLVLFEFTAYSSNDMIMPGMLQVVKYFHAPEYYVALAFSVYLIGDCAFLLMVGFISERFGKSKIIIWGNFLFILFTMLILFSMNIQQFMLWRFLQGAGLTIIPIGYALIHEKFNDTNAIKLQALMGNVSTLAPLIGPALGSLIMSFFSWQYIFGITAIFGMISFFGLFRYAPKDNLPNTTFGLYQVTMQYGLILKNKEFMKGMLCSFFIIMPLMIWISQAPNLILFKLHLNYSHYVIYQIISIGGLSISSILMQFIVGRYRMYSIVIVGSFGVLIGSLIILIGSNHIEIIAWGIFIYALGMGLANGCLCRLIMTIKGHSHAMLASMLGFLQTLLIATTVTILNEIISYYQFSLWSFTLSMLLFGFIGFLLTTYYISTYKNRDWL